MAMLDDPDWLLQYIQHSFITSDDTGMCEMVLHDNDMMTLEQHKHRIKQMKELKRAERAKKNQKKGLPESFGRSTPVGSPRRLSPDTESVSSTGTPTIGSNNSEDISPLAPSPDIQSGWDFGVRRRSNTAQKLERIRKERQSRVKVNSVPWRKKNSKLTEEQLSSMFEKKNLHENDAARDSDTSRVNVSTTEKKTLSIFSFVQGNLKLSNEVTKHVGFNVENDECDLNAVEDIESPSRTWLIESSQHSSRSDTVDSGAQSDRGDEGPIIRKRGMSALAKLLTQSVEQYDNPFRKYAKFDGHGHGVSGIKKVDIFVCPHGVEKPKFSTQISVLAQKAKVQDVIGLACWIYSVEDQEPKLTGQTVQRFSLFIAEDDGTVDTDFPPLDPNEPFSKFSFSTLALVEKRPAQLEKNKPNERGTNETVFVKVNDYEGSSLVQVDDLSVTMGEVLRKTLKRRKGQNYTGKYVLEYQDKVGIVVNEEQSLESTGVMEFYLVREHSSRKHVQTNAFDGGGRTLPDSRQSPVNDNEEYRFPPGSRTPPLSTTHGVSDGFIFVPTMEYTMFRLYQRRKFRSPVPVDFGVGPNQIDVVPVNRREPRPAIMQFLSIRNAKTPTITIRIPMLAHCAVHDPKNRTSSLSVTPPSSSGSFSSSLSSFANQDSTSSGTSYEKTIFKLYYRLSEYHSDYKHLTLEGPADEVQDAIDKVRNVMALSGDRKLQATFEAIKFGEAQTTTSNSNNTLRRRGSLFG